MFPQTLYCCIEIEIAFLEHPVQDWLRDFQSLPSDWLCVEFQRMNNERIEEVAFVAACLNIFEHRTKFKAPLKSSTGLCAMSWIQSQFLQNQSGKLGQCQPASTHIFHSLQ
jgi:hypothetical protein